MKYIFVAVLVIHGLIHLLGFTKAFGLAQPPQLQAAISRPMGILWLAAALLLTVSAGTVLLAVRWWWVPAAFGVVLSQVLIFTAWNDAKAGTIANIILLFPIVVAALSAVSLEFPFPLQPGSRNLSQRTFTATQAAHRGEHCTSSTRSPALSGVCGCDGQTSGIELPASLQWSASQRSRE